MYSKSKGTAGKSWTKQQHSYAVGEVGISRERSTFMRPSRTLTGIDAGFIYPVLVDEVLPGDTFQVSAGLLGRLSTPIRTPIMDRIYLDTFFFFVPNRLVWENWQRFQGEKDDPGDVTTYSIPQMEIAGGDINNNNLADYMGIPVRVVNFKVNALPFRGYSLIWNEYFRDTNLQDSIVVDKDNADSTESDYVLQRRGKRKDYLTGCLPWPQRPGDGLTPGIISGTVPVVGTTVGIPSLDVGGLTAQTMGSLGSGSFMHWAGSPTSDATAKWNVTGLEADLDNAQANNINQLRQSIAIQQLLELDARGGTRYKEQLKARFGVTTPDFRLQRPEYLGGGSTQVGITTVPATNQSSQIDQATLAGYGVAQGSAGGFTHSFTEHGFVFCLISMRADYTYFQGLPRFWRRETRYDFFEPALAHLGEQAVLNSEIFVSNDANDDLVFGYQERFSEYKYGNSMVTSVMRPDNEFPLDIWHLAEEFPSLPTLGSVFIEENPPIPRVLKLTDQSQVILDIYFQNRCTRVMPVFNTPGLKRL